MTSRTLDLQRTYPDGRKVDVAEIHTLGAGDSSPVQMISAELLEHYRQCEAELRRVQAVSYVLPAR